MQRSAFFSKHAKDYHYCAVGFFLFALSSFIHLTIPVIPYILVFNYDFNGKGSLVFSFAKRQFNTFFFFFSMKSFTFAEEMDCKNLKLWQIESVLFRIVKSLNQTFPGLWAIAKIYKPLRHKGLIKW